MTVAEPGGDEPVPGVTIRPYRPADHAAGRRLWSELAEDHRILYGLPPEHTDATATPGVAEAGATGAWPPGTELGVAVGERAAPDPGHPTWQGYGTVQRNSLSGARLWPGVAGAPGRQAPPRFANRRQA